MTDKESSELSGLRVGFFTSVTHMGGSEVLFADAIEAICRSGAEVVCWSHPASAIREILASRTPRIDVSLLDWPGPVPAAAGHTPAAAIRSSSSQRLYRAFAPASLKKLTGFFKEYRVLCDEIHRVRPDVLFINVDGSEPACLAAARQIKDRVITCYHLSVTQSQGNFADRLVDRLKKMISIWSSSISVHTSQGVRNQWCKLCLYPLKRTRVIYNGVDEVPIDPIDRTQVLGPISDRFVFCVPGRLHPVKGHRYLLDAVTLNRAAFEGSLVLISGDGPARQELEARCSAEGLQEIVRFLGWRADLKQVLRASDCTVLPSIASENSSVAVLESLMAGTPAIVTSVGGMAEAVQDSVTGLVVPPASPQALHDAMLRMMTHRSWARQLGEHARRDAQARFTRARMMAEYVELLKTVAAA